MIAHRLTLAFSLVVAATLALPARAHVSLEQPEAPRGKSYKAVLKVPHGCDGQATHTVRVEIPEGFIGAKPMPKAGWTIKTKRGSYARTYGYFHGPLSEGVTEIEWSGGSLPNDYYDEFVAAGYVAKELEADTLYFKVVQLCDTGELNWVELPAKGQSPHDLEAPAAVLKIAGGGAAEEHAHKHDHHEHGKAAAESTDARIGSVTVEGGWARATAEGAKVGAGYLKLRNDGQAADTLVSVSTSIAGKSEIHDMTVSDDGVMRMRHLAKGLEIPAGGSIELKPGGMHLMFLDLKQPLVEAQPITVKLTFKSGAEGEIVLAVRPLGGGGADKGKHDHDAHDHDHGHGHH